MWELSRCGRFLLVTWDGGGNVPPMLGLARELNRRGHVVGVLGPPALEARAEAAGATFRPFATAQEPNPRERAVEEQLGAYLRHLCGEALARDVMAELARDAADILVADCMLPAAMAAGERASVPTAALVHFLYGTAVAGPWAERWRFALPAVNETRGQLGLAPLDGSGTLFRMLFDRCQLVLAATLQALDAPSATMPDNVRYVGPIFEDAGAGWQHDLPWPPADERPLVVVSFSTTYQHQEAAMQRALDALAELPVRALASLGGVLPADGMRAPPNAVVRAWVPHAAILPEASVVVTHAGHGTVTAALAHGVPLVCLPMGRDQNTLAARVEACEVGIALPPEADAATIRTAVAQALSSPSCRRNAAAMAELIRRAPGAPRAADELERLLAS